ncbi:MAG: ribosomal-processing cysteine protease Prp [Christensenellales bacterium]
MSRVLLLRNAGGDITGFEVRGHAGFAEAGRDIVCAALSFLCTTCANALESVAGAKPRVRQSEALLQVHLTPLNPAASIVFRVFEQGVKDLREAYPEYIDLVDQKLL